jgi:hypothetical protein
MSFFTTLLAIGLMLGGLDILLRFVPPLHWAYHWLLRFFFVKPIKWLWKRTKRQRKRFSIWLWGLPGRLLRFIGRQVRRGANAIRVRLTT